MQTQRRAGAVGRGWLPALAACALALAAAPAAAQDRPRTVVLRGTVEDTAGVGVRGAEVTILGGSRTVTTGAQGRFLVPDLPVGRSVVRVRYIEYKPLYFEIEVAKAERADTVEVIVTLDRRPLVLPEVVVVGRAGAADETIVPSRLEGFYERRARGAGDFFTQRDIERMNPMRVADVLRTVAGFTPSSRGVNPPSRCNRATVWVNGAPIRGNINNALDTVSPYDVQAMEVYKGVGELPPEYGAFGSTCAILIWTK